MKTTTATTGQESKAAWSAGRLAWLVVLLVLAVLAALPSWHNVLDLALRSDEYSHMLLVLPVVGLLLWQRRERVARIQPRYCLWGVVVAALGVAMDFVGFATQIDLIKDVGMVAMFVAPVVAVAGWRWPLAALPAFGALLFLVPVPGRVRQQIALPLQETSATITQWFMDVFGQVVTRAGNVLQINGVDVAVAEACNGMRMVVALALVTYAFVFSMPLRPWARITLLIASPLVALIVNVIRLIPTVYFYGHWDREAADFAHDVSGWLVLALALGVLWGSVALARWLELPIEDVSETKPPVEPARGLPGTSKSGRAMLVGPLTAILLAAMAAYSIGSIRPSGSEAYFREVRRAIEELPSNIDGYRGVDTPVLPGAVELLRPNKLLQRQYRHPLTGSSFSVLIVHCGDVRDMMGHFPPVCYPSNGWTMEEAREDSIQRAFDGPIPITRYRVTRDDGTASYAKVIANTFVVPRADSPLGRDDRALDMVTRTRWSSGLGAAQVQIITDADMDEAERTEIERSVASELQGLIDAVAQPRDGEGEPT